MAPPRWRRHQTEEAWLPCSVRTPVAGAVAPDDLDQPQPIIEPSLAGGWRHVGPLRARRQRARRQRAPGGKAPHPAMPFC